MATSAALMLHILFMFQSSPAYSIPHQKSREESNEQYNMPPPNKYAINLKFIGRRCPAWKYYRNAYRIGTAERKVFKDADEHKPGPFDYNNDKSVVLIAQPKIRIGEKLKTQRTSHGPGPGAYQPSTETVLRRNPVPVFPKDLRRIVEERDGPGPADYSPLIDFNRTNISMFSRAQRFRTEEYRSLNATISHQVNLQSTMHRSPSYKFGSQKRDILYMSQECIPGPNKYDIKMDSILRKTEGGTIGREKRRIHSEARKKSRSPGPGDYNINVSEGSSTFVIPKSPRGLQIATARNPGPADYTPNVDAVRTKNPRTIIPKSVDMKKLSRSPDPWSYNLKTQSAKGITFAKQKRLNRSYKDAPAPNSYYLPNAFAVAPPYEKSRLYTK